MKKEENVKKIKDLTTVIDRVLNHLDNLSKYTTNIEECFLNKELIIDLDKTHLETRNMGKVILQEDLTKLSSNIFFKLMAKNIKPTLIQFINLVTDYTEQLIGLISNEENKKVKEKEFLDLIKNINELNKVSQTQFKGLKEKLEMIGR